MILKVLYSKITRRIFRITALSISGILLLLFLISALLLIPSIQTRLTNKAAQILSEKTGIKIEVGGVYIAFPKTIRMENLYAEDIQKDTLDLF